MTDENGFEEIKGRGEAEGYTFHIKSHPELIPKVEPKFTQLRCSNCMCENRKNPTDEIAYCGFLASIWAR